jgi:hypothetical protein
MLMFFHTKVGMTLSGQEDAAEMQYIKPLAELP